MDAIRNRKGNPSNKGKTSASAAVEAPQPQPLTDEQFESFTKLLDEKKDKDVVKQLMKEKMIHKSIVDKFIAGYKNPQERAREHIVETIGKRREESGLDNDEVVKVDPIKEICSIQRDIQKYSDEIDRLVGIIKENYTEGDAVTYQEELNRQIKSIEVELSRMFKPSSSKKQQILKELKVKLTNALTVDQNNMNKTKLEDLKQKKTDLEKIKQEKKNKLSDDDKKKIEKCEDESDEDEYDDYD
jgi:hypothetical protein